MNDELTSVVLAVPAMIKRNLRQSAILLLRWWKILGRNPRAATRSFNLKPMQQLTMSLGLTFCLLSVLATAASSIVWTRTVDFSLPTIVIGIAVLFAAACCILLALLPRSVWQSSVPYFGAISAIAFLPASLFFTWYAHLREPVDGDFFSTAGQVLPIFVLAVLVDMRVSRSVAKMQLVIFILVIALGEFESLLALAFESARNSIEFGAACGSFIGGFIGLTMAIVAHQK